MTNSSSQQRRSISDVPDYEMLPLGTLVGAAGCVALSLAAIGVAAWHFSLGRIAIASDPALEQNYRGRMSSLCQALAAGGLPAVWPADGDESALRIDFPAHPPQAGSAGSSSWSQDEYEYYAMQSERGFARVRGECGIPYANRCATLAYDAVGRCRAKCADGKLLSANSK